MVEYQSTKYRIPWRWLNCLAAAPRPRPEVSITNNITIIIASRHLTHIVIVFLRLDCQNYMCARVGPFRTSANAYFQGRAVLLGGGLPFWGWHVESVCSGFHAVQGSTRHGGKRDAATSELGRLHSYLIFVIFFTQAKFLENKIYTEKRQFFALNL